jgi:hypothetical protein
MRRWPTTYYENRERIDADNEAAQRYAAEMKAKAGPSRLQVA